MAAIDIEFKVIGIREVVQRLHQVETKLERKILRKAAREAARPIRAKAESLAPMDSGRLKRSIKIRAKKRSRRGFGVNVWTGTREELEIDSEARGYYPMSLEYGFVTASGTRVAERSFMRRALEEETETALDIFEREVLTGLEAALV